jgi:nucleoid DNA-binding protein
MASKTNVTDLAHDVHRDNHHLGLSKADVETLLRSGFEQILSRVAAGETVEVRGFGVFSSKVFPGRTLSSPLMKGGSIDFPDQLVLRFRQSQQAKKAINSLAEELAAKKAGKKAKKVTPKAVDTDEAEGGAEAEEQPTPKAKKGGGKAAPAGGKKGKPAPAPEPEEPEAEAEAADDEAPPAKPAKKKNKKRATAEAEA